MSKYLNRVYENYKVVAAYRTKSYKRRYGSESTARKHPAYSYVLQNQDTGDFLTISGNQLRLIANGSRSIYAMLNTKATASKNPQINCIISKRK